MGAAVVSTVSVMARGAAGLAAMKTTAEAAVASVRRREFFISCWGKWRSCVRNRLEAGGVLQDAAFAASPGPRDAAKAASYVARYVVGGVSHFSSCTGW
ncbi:hypothetical protein GCM10022409_20820 [Hymenobacter glaciei]|uniref:Uncharacterized protein n=1 Tax=Hymenobacter glaciei TaxID=877209 RepID=A0ABP7U4I0_9BACT